MGGSTRAARRLAKASARQASLVASAKRAVGYLRVSTEEQVAHEFGLQNQETAIRAFATSQGYELVDVVADRGISGATVPSGRPGFARILDLAAAGVPNPKRRRCSHARLLCTTCAPGSVASRRAQLPRSLAG